MYIIIINNKIPTIRLKFVRKHFKLWFIYLLIVIAYEIYEYMQSVSYVETYYV